MLTELDIMNASAKIADRDGFVNLSLKNLAAELGIKPPSLYNHVKSLENLRSRLTLFGWNEIAIRISDSVAGVSGESAIRKLCKVFYDYAMEHPGVFESMLWYNQCSSREAEEVSVRLLTVINNVILSLGVRKKNLVHTTRTFRSFLEGFCLLCVHNAFGDKTDIKKSFDKGVDILISGIKESAAVPKI